MGTCRLTFDQIRIRAKRSDSNHSDNDWLIATWFVGPNLVRTDKIALVKPDGSPVLEAGSVIGPLTLGVDANTMDLVTVTYVVVNLGFISLDEQIEAAGKIAAEISEAMTAIYLKAAQIVLSKVLGEEDIWKTANELLSPVLVDLVGSAWGKVIVPAVQEVVRYFQELLGHPDCNGEVLHDFVVFEPGEPAAPESWSREYSAASPEACGAAPRTDVFYLRERIVEEQPQFPTTPAPATWYEPVHAESRALWKGNWAESTTITHPIVLVTIGDNLLAPGKLNVDAAERADLAGGTTLATNGVALSPHAETIPVFGGNVFGRAKHLGSTDAGGVDAPRMHARAPSLPHGVIGNPPPQSRGSIAIGDGGPNIPTQTAEQNVQVITLPTHGVRLALYAVHQGDAIVGHAVRYMRAASSELTEADVMLLPWAPLR